MPLHTDFSRLTQSRSPLAAAISLVLGAASPGVVHAQEAAGNSASPVLAAAAEGQSTTTAASPSQRDARRSHCRRAEVSQRGLLAEVHRRAGGRAADGRRDSEDGVSRASGNHAFGRPAQHARALRCWQARAAGLPTPRATASSCAASTQPTASSSTACATRALTAATFSISTRWKCRKVRPVRTPDAAMLRAP